jgi:hypothetical protein
VFSAFLGLNIHTNDLTTETPARHIQWHREILLRHWNRNRNSFIAQQAAQFIGNFVSCLQGCHWLKLVLAFEFTRLLRTSLSHNAHRLIHTQHFDALLNKPFASWLEPTARQRDAKLLGLKSEYARALWRCKQSTWIPKAAHDQAAYLVKLIDKDLQGKCRWYKPISHIV